MDWPRLRERLRLVRKSLTMPDGSSMTLNDAAEKAGVDRSTIHSLENIKREPNLIPDTATLVALAKAYDLKLWPLIREAEEVSDREQILTEESLTARHSATHNPPSSEPFLVGGVDGGPARILSAAHSGASVNTPASDLIIGHALIDAGTFLINRGTEAGGSGEAVAPPPPPKSGPRPRGTRNR